MKSINPQNLSLSNSKSFIYFQNKKELNTLNIKLTSLVKVPIQNSNVFSIIKDSSISSLLAFSDEIRNKASKEGTLYYKNSIKHSLYTTNNTIQYLQSTSYPTSLLSNSFISIREKGMQSEDSMLIEKKNKIYDIKQNNQSFVKFNSNQLHYNYFTLKKSYSINNYSKNRIIKISQLLKKLSNRYIKIKTKKNIYKNLNILFSYAVKNSKLKYKFLYRLYNKLNKFILSFNSKYKKEVQLKNQNKVKPKKHQKIDLKKNQNKIKLKKHQKINLKNQKKNQNKKQHLKPIDKKIKNLIFLKQKKLVLTFYKGLITSLKKDENLQTKELGGFNLNNTTLSQTQQLTSLRLHEGPKEGESITFNQENINKLIFLLKNKSLIEDYLKLNNLGSIKDFKNIKSLNYKNLSFENKKIISALNYIETYSIKPNNAPFLSETEKKGINTKLVMPKIKFIKSISPFNNQLAKSKNIMYYFNKKNTYNIFKNEEIVNDILEAAFLTMNSFISKAYFYAKPDSVLINLFFFWLINEKSMLNNFVNKIKNKKNYKKNKKIKSKIKHNMVRKRIHIKNIKKYNNWKFFEKINNTNDNNNNLNLNFFLKNKKYKKIDSKTLYRDWEILNYNSPSERKIKKFLIKFRNFWLYARKFSMFAIIFQKKIKILTWIITKLLKKRVNFQLTRIYYPQNDSNILVTLVGFLAFWIKFNKIVSLVFKNVNFKLKKFRLFKLKYRHIPSMITGLNVKLAGRISKVRRKVRVKSNKWYLGNLHKNVNNLATNNNFTNKTLAGAFNINIIQNATALK